ncbi:unnamed protein product [Citrullus colocynthis]|uniref:Sialate O-acetylesterase domain-containing protein n=1 Tax=Citrullus colocynthis TaxID=252529 RepID=A0ABP0YPK9_9ROSI
MKKTQRVKMALLRLSILLCTMLFDPSLSGATSTKNIFILAGRSNMAGRGGLEKNNLGNLTWDGYAPPLCQPNSSILRLNPKRQWEVAREPLHRGIDLNKTVGIGPRMPFAFQFIAKVEPKVGVVGLVPCARGGSLIGQWRKNHSNPKATFYKISLNESKHQIKKVG